MKVPIDPSEPMFPIRPNEPVCQYYMKHGTCKFGQACKFHHPPQSPTTAALVGGGTCSVVMNVARKNDSSQILLNPVGTDSNGSPMMLQFLPQRPDEPDCIFFLKNGRCKYGATCRYHHPVNFHQRRQDDVRRQRPQMQQVHDGMKLQFVGQSVPQHKFQQGGTHVVTSDGSVAFMTLDGSAGPQASHQTIPVSIGNDLGNSYGNQVAVPISVSQEHASSSSSIASSYDTASSNLPIDVAHGDPSSGLWNRPKSSGRNGVTSYTTDSSGAMSHSQLPSYAPRMGHSQNTSDGSVSSRRHRSASYGSASDNSSYLDKNGPLNRPGGSSMNSVRAWRSERSASYDGTRSQDHAVNFHSEAARSPVMRGTIPKQRRNQPSTEAVDAGLSMMTSALLNMLDTPEDVPIDNYEQQLLPPSVARDGRKVNPHIRDDSALSHHPAEQGMSRPAYYHQESGEHLDQDIFCGLAVNARESDTRYQDTRPPTTRDDSGAWFPSWQGMDYVGRPMDENAQSMSVIQPRHTPPTSSPHTANIFLP